MKLTEATRFYAIITAYAAIGFVVFGHYSHDVYIHEGCPVEPGFARGSCYESNAYRSVLKGLAWPVYYPASLLIHAGRGLTAGRAALQEVQE